MSRLSHPVSVPIVYVTKSRVLLAGSVYFRSSQAVCTSERCATIVRALSSMSLQLWPKRHPETRQWDLVGLDRLVRKGFSQGAWSDEGDTRSTRGADSSHTDL